MTSSAFEMLQHLVDDGFTRTEAFAIILADRGVTTISLPAASLAVNDEERTRLEREIAVRDAQIAMLQNVIEALKNALAPQYLTDDDLEQIINRAVKEASQ